MRGENYYLLTALPSLSEPDEPAAPSKAELLEKLEANPSAAAQVRAIFLGDDLLQRQAYQAGEVEAPAPTVLTRAQLEDEEPLPDFLAEPRREDRPPRVPTDAMWAAYYRHVAEVADARDGEFLRAWLGFEVALRNALASARAAALGLEPADYLLVRDLGDESLDLSGALTEWSSARDPLAGLRALDRARWNWLTMHDAWFTFADDEIVAYAAKLVLVHRRRKLTQTEEQSGAA